MSNWFYCISIAIHAEIREESTSHVQLPPGRAKVPVFRRLKNLCISYFTQPAADRPIAKLIHSQRARKILQIGVGDGARALRLIQTAQREHPGERISFAGIDLFEARPAAERKLSLKEVHRKLSVTDAKIMLVPGDPYGALERVANALLGTELVLISADQRGESLDRAWFYVPRLLASDATVLVESHDATTNEPTLQPLSRLEVEALAKTARRRRVAA
jgi:hypothetical protein